jgi:hypothetical protein
MKSSIRLCLGLLLTSSVFAFAGCGDDDDAPSDGGGGSVAQGGQTASGGASDGAQKCEEIAELCHPVDPGDGPLHECHEQSEVGNASKCLEIYDSCIAQCQAAHDAAQGGAGGGNSGGMSSVGGAEDAMAGASSGGAGGAP